MKKLEGKNVLITGSAQGIGLDTAREFAKAGSNIILTDINPEKLEVAANELEKFNVQVFRFVVDVTDRKAVELLAADVIARCGRIDILINNAGVGLHEELENTTMEQWDKLIAVNLSGPLYHIYAFLPYMKQQGNGQIVNVSSGQAFFRMPTWGAYAAIKLAMGAISEILHYELRKYNIKVTTVYPYMVNTGFYKDVEQHNLSSRLMVKLLPFYSQKPKKVGRIVFNAVRRGKRIEMVNLLNYAGKYIHLFSPISSLFNKAVSFALGKDKDKWKDIPGAQKATDLLESLLYMLRSATGKVGFRMNEIMSGEHEFVGSDGRTKKRMMEFNVQWGADNLYEWLNPFSDNFMSNELEGTVTIDGLCQEAPCFGTLNLRYFSDHKICYEFEFDAEDRPYTYTGEKRNIMPWNLHKSHTTCYGEVHEADTGALVSTSTTYFKLGTIPAFLSSFRLMHNGEEVNSESMSGE